MNRVTFVFIFTSLILSAFGIYTAHIANSDVNAVKILVIKHSDEIAVLRSRVNQYILWELVYISHLIERKNTDSELVSFKILAINEVLRDSDTTEAIRSEMDRIYARANSDIHLRQLADVMRSNMPRFRN